MQNPRSGTTALRHALSETGRFYPYGEVFHNDRLDIKGNFFKYILNQKLDFVEVFNDLYRITEDYINCLCDAQNDLIPIIDVKMNSWEHDKTIMASYS